jgi:hypothetical protein
MRAAIILMGIFAVTATVQRGHESSATGRLQWDLPVGWVEVAEPSEGSLRCANWSPFLWRVEPAEEGVPVVVGDDGLRPRRDPIPWPFGCPSEGDGRIARRVAANLGTAWLVGCDLGSYGGGLWLVASDGTSREAWWSERVWDIVVAQARTWALAEGAEYGSGVVLEAVPQEGSWAVRPYAEVRGYPVGLFGRGRKIFLVTRKGLFALAERSATLLMPLDLERLFPTSVATSQNGDVYVAMRHYLLRLRSTSAGWTRQWLAPASCRSFRPMHERPCECVRPDDAHPPADPGDPR